MADLPHPGAPEDRSSGHAAAAWSLHPRGTAKDRALRLLGVRGRSQEELRRRLARAGFDAQEIDEALTELEGVGLIDDARFARELVKDHADRRHSGQRLIRGALSQRGIEAEVAQEALQGLDDEADRAFRLASTRATRLSGIPPEAAYRRLYGLLLRRGYGPTVARDASRAALAPTHPSDGAWDQVGDDS